MFKLPFFVGSSMQRLTDILLRDDTRWRLVRDVAELIEHEVDDQRGLTGAAIRSGYRLVTRMRDGLIRDALDDMLDAFVSELDPLWFEHGSLQGFDQFLAAHRCRVAQRMLQVTDARRDTARNRSLRSAYDRLGPVARPRIERAVPRLGQVIQKYLDELVDQDHELCPSAA